MKLNEIHALLKLHEGRLASVITRIIEQDRLEDDDHNFLRELWPGVAEGRIPGVDPVLFALQWLWHFRRADTEGKGIAPAGLASQIVVRLREVLRLEGREAGEHARGQFVTDIHCFVLPFADRIDPEAWAELAEDLVALTEGTTVQNALLASIQGTCAQFNKLARIAGDLQSRVRPDDLNLRFDPSGRQRRALVRSLLECRHDERRLRLALLDMLESSDLEQRAYVLWSAESAGVLEWLAPPVSVLPDRVAFRLEAGHPNDREWQLGRYFMRLALRWPDAQAGRRWLVDQIVDAAGRGAPWGWLWWVCFSYRDEVALASLERGTPAPWAGAALRRGLSIAPTDELWATALKWVERGPTTGTAPLNGGVFAPLSFDADLPITQEEAKAAFRDDQPLGNNSFKILEDAPLPAIVSERFVDRFVSAWRAASARLPEVAEQACVRQALFNRLAQFPPSSARDKYLLDLMIDAPELLRGPHALELARSLGPIPADRLPSPEAFCRGYADQQDIETYRALGGDLADKRLAEWVTSIAPLAPLPAAHVCRLCPDIATPDVRTAVRAAMRASEQFPRLLWQRKELTWLLSDEEAVEYLDANLDREGCAWDSVPVDELTADACLRRLNQHRSARECVYLIGKLMEFRRTDGTGALDKVGALRHLALCLTADAGDAYAALDQMAAMLPSASAWREYGVEVVDTIIGGSALGLVAELARRVVSRAADKCERTEGQRTLPPNLLPSIHLAVAGALLRRVQDAAAAGDWVQVRRALAGIAELRPPAELRKSLHRFAKTTRLPDEVAELVEVNQSLLHHADGSDATVGQIGAAIRTFAGVEP